MKKRKTYSAGFKTKVVLEVLQERETVREIARKYDLHPSQISTWKSQFISNADVVFERGSSGSEDDKEKDALLKKVGQLQLEVDFLKKSIGEIAKKDRMGKIDKTHSLSVSRRCELMNVAQSSFYYSPLEDGSYNEELMKQIDKQYMITPFYDVPRMTNYLRGLVYEVNPKRIRRLYRKMDLYAVGPRPNTSKFHKGRPCHLSLLATWADYRALQPGLGDGYHLYPLSRESYVFVCHN